MIKKKLRSFLVDIIDNKTAVNSVIVSINAQIDAKSAFFGIDFAIF